MDWTTQPDNVQRCAGPLGAVTPSERVARLLHSGHSGEKGAFQCSEIFNSDNKPISNVCGESSGLSLTRCDGLTNDELCQRSRLQAARVPNRIAKGAITAAVIDLRGIKVDKISNEQVVFIYDDPLTNDCRHVILRGKDSLKRSDQKYVRDIIMYAFSVAVVEP